MLQYVRLSKRVWHQVCGHFPQAISQLWINAWDPLSIPDNGNGATRALMVFIGRVSTIAVVCNAITHPYLKLSDRYISLLNST
jgi:hypothetical protein